MSNGNGSLNYKAGIDISNFIKSADQLRKEFKELQKAGSTIGAKGFEVKPLTEYQAGLLKIKQEALELAKAKAAQATADKAASLVTQAALKEEARLRREQLAEEKAILKQLAAEDKAYLLNKINLEKAAKSVKKPVTISDSQAEVDAYNKAAAGSTIYTSAINAQVVARARDTQQAAAQAIAEGNLRTQQSATTAAVVQSTAANKSNILTKIQAAKLLAEEKYIQAQATRELKNNIREQLNAKGSLEQRRAALIRLQTAYDRLSASERSSAAGNRLGNIIKGVSTQVLDLEVKTNRAQRNVGNYMSAFTGGLSSVWAGLSKIAQIIPGLGIGGIFIAGFAALGFLLDRLNIFKSTLDKLDPAQKALNTSYQEAAGLIAKEGAETTLLVSKIRDNTRSVAERQALLNDFIGKNPAVLGALNLQNIATEKGTAIINDYIAALKRKIEMQALEKGYSEALEKKADIESGKEDTSIGWLGKSLITANKVLAGFKGETIGEAIDKANARFKNQALDAQNNIIKSYEDRIKTTVEGEAKIAKVQDTSLAAAEAKLSQVNERLRTLQQGESDKSLKQQKAQLEKEIKQRTAALGLDTNTSAGKAEVRAQETALKSRNNLQKKIDDLTKKGVDKQLSADEQEVNSVKKKYEDMRKEAVKFNNDPKNKKLGLRVDGSSLKKAEDTEVKEVKDKSAAKTLKDTLDQQAKYYAEYEDLKTKIGHDKAKERYKDLINTDQTYLDQLEEKQKEKKNADNPFAMKLLSEEVTAANIAIQKADDERYAMALQAAMTHAQALEQIDREYWANRKALGDGATEEQIANLDRQKQDAIRNANETNAYLKGGYDELMHNYDAMTRDQIRKRLQAIKDGYRKEYEEGRLTAEQLANLVDEIDGNLDKLNGNNSFSRITTAIKNYREQVALLGKDSEGAKSAQQEMFAAMAQGAADINEVFGEVAGSLEQLGIGGEGLQDVFKNVQGAVDGIGKIGQGLATGNPVDVVTGSIKLLTSAIDLFNTKDKKLQKQINNYKDQLDSLGKAYNQLDRAVNDSVGESFYTDSAKQIENLKKQQALLIQMRDAEARKKKSDKGKIAEYNAELDEIPNKIADISKAMAENLIQTNFSQLSRNLADALSEAFASGEDSAKAFDDVFRNVIANAVKNSLKLKILEPTIKKFTDDLTKYASQNGNSVVGFDFNSWKDELKKAGDLFNAGLKGSEEYFKQIGLDDSDSGSSDSALTKNVKQITSDQANALEGIMRGQYEQTKLVVSNTSLLNPINNRIGDLFNTAKQGLIYQAEIALNTANTVLELKNTNNKLDKVISNTKPDGFSTRGSGFGT